MHRAAVTMVATWIFLAGTHAFAAGEIKLAISMFNAVGLVLVLLVQRKNPGPNLSRPTI
jgi:hypothetical protein